MKSQSITILQFIELLIVWASKIILLASVPGQFFWAAFLCPSRCGLGFSHRPALYWFSFFFVTSKKLLNLHFYSLRSKVCCLNLLFSMIKIHLFLYTMIPTLLVTAKLSQMASHQVAVPKRGSTCGKRRRTVGFHSSKDLGFHTYPLVI